jgi:hypothetical protein
VAVRSPSGSRTLVACQWGPDSRRWALRTLGAARSSGGAGTSSRTDLVGSAAGRDWRHLLPDVPPISCQASIVNNQVTLAPAALRIRLLQRAFLSATRFEMDPTDIGEPAISGSTGLLMRTSGYSLVVANFTRRSIWDNSSRAGNSARSGRCRKWNRRNSTWLE